jgi:hypothetical protein
VKYYFLAIVATVVAVANAEKIEPISVEAKSSVTTWLDRPWDTRYFLYVTTLDQWDAAHNRALQKINRSKGDSASWKAFASPRHQIRLKSDPVIGDQSLAIVALEFDRDGGTKSLVGAKQSVSGRINALRELGVSDGVGAATRFHFLAYWFTGIGDASTHWAPAFCPSGQQPNPLVIKSDTYLYGAAFKADEFSPLFGCREWAAQLMDDARPYIDVTSYQYSTRNGPPRPSIREFVGWARFNDHKPVIGNHGGDWYCLFDCPSGEEPGRINDIRAWTQKMEWPMPLPPLKMPVFPDPPARPGAYPVARR